jgi:malate synthase
MQRRSGKAFDAIVTELAPKNLALLAERDRLQAELDAWHKANPGPIRDMKGYRAFLGKDRLPGAGAGQRDGHRDQRRRRTGAASRPATGGAGAQCPLRAERGQRALGLAVRRALRHRRHPRIRRHRKGQGLQPGARREGDRLCAQRAGPGAPLAAGSHKDATLYRVRRQAGRHAQGRRHHRPEGCSQFAGYQGESAAPSSVLLRHNGIHLDIRIDRGTAIGKDDAAGISDLVLEAALSTIMDLEDSVAVVDAQTRCWPIPTGWASCKAR